jgi:hypothetical protein
MVLTASTPPDDRILDVFSCKLKDGKTMDEAHAANAAWVVFMNANVEGGDIGSFVLTPRVGDNEEGTFIYVDSYPSLESWAAGDKATKLESGKAVMAALGAVATCSKNALYNSRES